LLSSILQKREKKDRVAQGPGERRNRFPRGRGGGCGTPSRRRRDLTRFRPRKKGSAGKDVQKKPPFN